MAKVTTDAAGKLELYFRIARNSVPKTMTFLNESGDDYSLAGLVFQMNFIDPDRGTNAVQLTSGAGLTIGPNTIAFALTSVQSDLPKDFYFWELVETTTNRTWIFDKAYFMDREPAEVGEEAELTVKLTGETINVTVTSGTGGVIDSNINGGTL